MKVLYQGVTSKHVKCIISLHGQGYSYSPPVALSGFAMKPEAIQAPRYLPGNTSLGNGYTTPESGLWLDYAEYSPIVAEADGVKDFYQANQLQDLLEILLCRDVWAWYLLPDEEPDAIPAYPKAYTDGEGYTHGFPSQFGTNASGGGDWVMTNEYVEGMAINLDCVDLALAVVNNLPDGWHDGRDLCLEGGGVIPLHPEFCQGACSVSTWHNFCISASPTWDENFAHGYGNIPAERTQMMLPDSQTIQGFPITNSRGTVTAVPIYGPTVYADEYVDVDFFTWPSFTPAPPRIYPPPKVDAPGVAAGLVALGMLGNPSEGIADFVLKGGIKKW